jgi:hypothetical protein
MLTALRLYLCGLIVLFPAVSSAATLYIDPPQVTLNRGDAVTLAVRLDTDETVNECINAIDAVITFDGGVAPVDVSTGGSIMPVWVEAPTIDKEKRQITFAGGIPNGYCGRVAGDPKLTNTIAELVFRAPGLSVGGDDAQNEITVAFAPETTAYLNDGFGTAAITATLGSKITLTDSPGTTLRDDWREAIIDDTIPPEEFSIELLQGDGISFGTDWYIVFNTTDKQTGISRYEVIEEAPEEAKLFSFGAATAPWQTTRSPYVLQDQSLRSTIRVRAIDKAGNEYVATLAPQNAERYTIESVTVFMIFGGLVILLGLGLLVFWLMRRKNRRLMEKFVTPESDQSINAIK